MADGVPRCSRRSPLPGDSLQCAFPAILPWRWPQPREPQRAQGHSRREDTETSATDAPPGPGAAPEAATLGSTSSPRGRVPLPPWRPPSAKARLWSGPATPEATGWHLDPRQSPGIVRSPGSCLQPACGPWSQPRDQDPLPVSAEGHLLPFSISQAPPQLHWGPHGRHSQAKAELPTRKESMRSPNTAQPQACPHELPRPGSSKGLTHRKDLTCYRRFRIFFLIAQHISCDLALVPKLPATNNPKPSRCWRVSSHTEGAVWVVLGKEERRKVGSGTARPGGC